MLERRGLEKSFSAHRLWAVVRDNRSFRRLYAANAVSQLGDWFNVVALFSLLVELTGAGEAVAIALLTRFVPTFFAGPAAGILADRVPRRTILVTSDVLRAALVLCLLFVRRPDQVWIAYAVVTAHSVISAFFEPAQAATFPSLVPAGDLAYAATLENSLWSMTLAAGSALGGLVLALAGRDLAFVLDALSFAGSALLIAGLPPSRAQRLDKQRLEVAEESRDGLVNLVLLASSARRSSSAATARASRRCGPRAAWAASSGPSPPSASWATTTGGLRRGIGWAFALLVVCYGAFAVSPEIFCAACALALANAGGSILWTSGSTLLQRLVPDGIRGRVAAAEMGGFMLTLSASTLTVGLLLDRGVPPRALMAACGLVALAPLAFWISVQPAFRVTEGRAPE